MSEFYIEVTEMVESGVSYDTIIDKMVAEGFPRAACRTVIDQIVDQLDARERADEIAAEAYYHGA
jgi:S-adenosylmethionine synthetase